MRINKFGGNLQYQIDRTCNIQSMLNDHIENQQDFFTIIKSQIDSNVTEFMNDRGEKQDWREIERLINCLNTQITELKDFVKLSKVNENSAEIEKAKHEGHPSTWVT